MVISEEHGELSAPESDVGESDPDLVAVQIARGSSFSGPLPPPEVLEGYERVQVGLAARIMEMAEREQGHQHEIARQQIALAERESSEAMTRSKIGLYLGAVVAIAFVAAAAAIAFFGHPYPAMVLGLTSVASIAGVFVYGAREQQRGRYDNERLALSSGSDSEHQAQRR